MPFQLKVSKDIQPVFIRLGHVNESPTMRCFGIPRHSQSVYDIIWDFDGVFLEILVKEMHCGNVVNMPY